MCGIVGAIGKNLGSIEVKKAIDLLIHRGPDSNGSFFTKNLFLGHTRLSIQDISSNGNQPMFSLDKRYVIIFNGEIYNHLELRSELLSDQEFKSTSDTETVLYAYIKYGISILKKLNGIFAFSIYDFSSKEIIIARDHFGVKPLYYYHKEDLFIFGSEIKSFTPFNIDLSLSPSSIDKYIRFLWSPGRETPLLNVKKLLPGSYLKFSLHDNENSLHDNENIKPCKFYKLDCLEQKSTRSEFELINDLENHLLKAVERQLLSDVPVGFFLSGGLDSSLIVAMVRKLHPDLILKCYTINLGMQRLSSEGFTDDLGYAKKVAEYLNAELNIINAEFDIVESFDKMIWHLDEPQADAAPLNVLKIANLARRQGVKVLIGGAAGDDLFSGYRRHRALQLEKFLSLSPRFIVRKIKLLLNSIPQIHPGVRRLKKLAVDLDQTPVKRQLGYFTWLSDDIVKSLFSDEWKRIIEGNDPFEYFHELSFDLNESVSDLDRMLYWELCTFLVDHNLNYTDKMGMAEGVEIRVPFLDLDLVKFSQSIPSALKMKGNETKYILKKVAERYLPHDVVYRPKTGFGAPVRKWITSDLEFVIRERLSPERIKQRGVFNADAVWKLINLNKSGKIDASYSIWALLAIESWCMQFIDGIDLKKPNT